MKHSLHDRTLALAGIYQSASLVKQIANRGMANSAIIESSIESLFRFDAETVEAVFGNLAGVAHGLRVLRDQFDSHYQRSDMELTRYVFSLVSLEKRLRNNTAILDRLKHGLQDIEAQLAFFDLGDKPIYSKLAELYKTTVSQLGPRIVVRGEQPYLSNEVNASKVRAILLAGIRSSVLWRQCGGSRWQFVFGRKAYLNECKAILERL